MVDLSLSDEALEETVRSITGFIDTQCEQAGVDGVVLGLSGGVDSAATAGLATKALGPGRAKALVLPAAPTSDRSVELAMEVADMFDLEVEIVDMEPIVTTVRRAYAEEIDRTSLGNVRARTRAVYWYLVANEEDRLVLGGGNRTEYLTGYCTKYGDIAVDCLPLGNLYKAQVRQVASHIGVPEEVVTRTPTAELWEDQTDEAELGIDYDTLDGIIAMYIDGEHSASETIEHLGIERGLFERIERLIADSAHKRRPPATPA